MKSNTRVVIATLAVGAVGVTAHAGLTVTPNNNADDLVSLILGPGISLVPGSATYTGAANASGSFAGGASAGITIDKGLLLTSGSVYNAPGPNNSDNATAENGLGGTPELNALIPGYTTLDASVLKFKFTSAGGDLFFNYVFGSEEYNEWVGSAFNDVFGFFLDGNNIALIPGTSTAVAINNVNETFNSSYYNNNDPSDLGTPTPFDIQYDGFTKVFTASVLGLSEGEHEISLQIADAGDWILDSGVFIQGGSFSDKPKPPTVPDGGSTLAMLSLAVAGLAGASRKLKRP